jgi:hypothetical protein
VGNDATGPPVGPVGTHHGPFGVKMVFMPATVAGRDGGAVLDGVVERVTFANPETGYTIVGIAPERGSGFGAELPAAWAERGPGPHHDARGPDSGL